MESVARQEGRAVSHTACGSPKGVNSRPDGGWGARCGVVRKNDSGRRRETEEREEPEWKRGTTRRGCSTHNPVDSAAYYTVRWVAGVCEDNTKPCYLEVWADNKYGQEKAGWTEEASSSSQRLLF